MIYLPKKEFYNFPTFQDKKYLKLKDDCIYKLIEDDKIKYIIYLNKLKPIKGLLLPMELLYDRDGIYGYKIPFINRSMNINEYINELNSPFTIDINKTINDMFNIIKQAHKKLIISDIRNDNILLTENEPLFIDLDNGYRKNKTPTSLVYYRVLVSDDIHSYYPICLQESMLTDTFKTFISALSLYYKYDFEYHFKYHSSFITMNEVYDFLKEKKAQEPFIEFLESLLNYKQGIIKKPKDFADISSGLENPSEETLILTRDLKKFSS